MVALLCSLAIACLGYAYARALYLCFVSSVASAEGETALPDVMILKCVAAPNNVLTVALRVAVCGLVSV